MKKLIIVCLLFVPLISSAKFYQTPSGIWVEADHPTWVEKTFRLPSGAFFKDIVRLETVSANLKYIATNLIPIAKASEKDLSIREEIELWLRSYEKIYDIPQLYKLAICESNIDPDVLGDKGMAKGLFQWWEKSWNFYNKKYKMGLNRDSWHDQLDMTVKVLQEKDGWENWANCWQYIKFGTWDKSKWK